MRVSDWNVAVRRVGCVQDKRFLSVEGQHLREWHLMKLAKGFKFAGKDNGNTCTNAQEGSIILKCLILGIYFNAGGLHTSILHVYVS